MPASLGCSRRLVRVGVLGNIFTLSLTFYAIVPYFTAAMHNDYGLTVAQAGWIISALPIGLICASLATAPLRLHKDGIPRLRLMLAATSVITAIAMCGIGLAPPLLALTTNDDRDHTGAHRLSPLALTGVMAAFRFVAGLAVGSGDTIGLVMLTRVFPDEASEIVAFTETCAGLGALVGPVIGGALYDLGGFATPPVTLAAMCVVATAVVVSVRLHEDTEPRHDGGGAAKAKVPPSAAAATERTALLSDGAAEAARARPINDDDDSRASDEDAGAAGVVGSVPYVTAAATTAASVDGEGSGDNPGTEEDEERRFSPRQVLRVLLLPFPLAVGPLMIALVCLAAFAFFEAIGPMYMLNHLDYSATVAGAVFAGGALVYAVSAIVSGSLLSKEHTSRRAVALPCGALLMALGALLSGPSLHAVRFTTEAEFDTMPLATKRAVSSVGFVLLAVGLAVAIVAGQAAVVDAAMSLDPKMANAGGALATGALSLASFSGIVIGSHLMESLTFPAVEAVFAAAIVAFSFLYVVGVGVSAIRSRRRGE